MLRLLRPAVPWPAGVQAAMSLREGGVSSGPWSSSNLSLGVGDVPQAVAANRLRFEQALGVAPVWMRQVHGKVVARLQRGAAQEPMITADAAWTTDNGVACTVGAADCMPVLFASTDGRAVAAAHAGWRGLALGLLPAVLHALQEGAGVSPSECRVWLGPCIGPRHFEVQDDVLHAFGCVVEDALTSTQDPAFKPAAARDGAPRWLADLPLLAQRQLHAAGVRHIHLSQRCTYGEPSDFFSFRRDGVTGRHAAAIWRV